jgi:hypothetical protein
MTSWQPNAGTLFEIIDQGTDSRTAPAIVRHELAGTAREVTDELIAMAKKQALANPLHHVQAVIDGIPVARFFFPETPDDSLS